MSHPPSSSKPTATVPVNRSVRIGDRERAALADRLSAHAAAGRLSVEELEGRLERAYAAVFARDLDALEADLPAPARCGERPPLRPPPAALLAVACLVAALALSVAIGHPVAPPLIAAALLWRAARPTSHRPLVPGRSSA